MSGTFQKLYNFFNSKEFHHITFIDKPEWHSDHSNGALKTLQLVEIDHPLKGIEEIFKMEFLDLVSQEKYYLLISEAILDFKQNNPMVAIKDIQFPQQWHRNRFYLYFIPSSSNKNNSLSKQIIFDFLWELFILSCKDVNNTRHLGLHPKLKDSAKAIHEKLFHFSLENNLSHQDPIKCALICMPSFPSAFNSKNQTIISSQKQLYSLEKYTFSMPDSYYDRFEENNNSYLNRYLQRGGYFGLQIVMESGIITTPNLNSINKKISPFHKNNPNNQNKYAMKSAPRISFSTNELMSYFASKDKQNDSIYSQFINNLRLLDIILKAQIPVFLAEDYDLKKERRIFPIQQIQFLSKDAQKPLFSFSQNKIKLEDLNSKQTAQSIDEFDDEIEYDFELDYENESDTTPEHGSYTMPPMGLTEFQLTPIKLDLLIPLENKTQNKDDHKTNFKVDKTSLRVLNSPSVLITNNFFYTDENQTLTFHYLFSKLKKLSNIIKPKQNGGYDFYSEQTLVHDFLTQPSLAKIVTHEQGQELYSALKSKFTSLIDLSSAQIIDLEYDHTNIDLCLQQYRFHINYKCLQTFSRDSRNLVSVLPVEHSNLPPSSLPPLPSLSIANYSQLWETVLLIIENGPSMYLNPESRDYVCGNRSKSRPHILKLLRHSGCYLYFLYTILEWVYNQPPEDHKILNSKQLEKVIKHLIEDKISTKIPLLLQSSNKTSETLNKDQVFTKKVTEFYCKITEDLVSNIWPTNQQLHFYNNQIFSTKGHLFHQGKVIYSYINHLIRITSGDVFKSSKNKYFPISTSLDKNASIRNLATLTHSITEEYDLNNLNSIYRSYPFQLESQAGKNLKSNNLFLGETISEFSDFSRLTFNGLPIEELTSNNFNVEFKLSNTNFSLPSTPLEAIGLQSHSHNPINWFDLHPQYFLNGKLITDNIARSLLHESVVEHDGRFYLINTKKLPTHRALEVFWNKLSNQNKSLNSSRDGERVSVGEQNQRHHILELLALRNMGIPFKGPPEWEQVCSYFDGLSSPSQNISLSKPLDSILKPYQKSGVQWLWDLYHLKLGGILADDMGLGKTLQTLTFINELKQKKLPHKSLIIVPVSLVYNWMAEVQKFTPQLKAEIFDPSSKRTRVRSDCDLLICTYGLLPNHMDKLQQEDFKIAFFDEAQNLKNRSTDRFTAAHEINIPFKIALTGTPLENHLSNLYSLMSIVAPGVLGTYNDFSKSYIGSDHFNVLNLDFLKAQLKPLILRRTKTQLLPELPEKTETQVIIDFSKKQKDLYKKTAISYSEKINELIAKNGENKSKLHMLSALLRLRQICSDPAGLPNIKFNEVPPKLEYLFDQIEEIIDGGHSVVLFTQFLSTFERIKNLAKVKKLPLFSLCGSDSRKSRVDTLAQFNEFQSGSILLMTLKTGGVGLNLTKANYIFHIDPWWNPAVENQATDRVHRIGQTKSISVYRLIMKESVEEKVELLKAKKGALFNSLFDENYFSNESPDSENQEVSTNSKASISSISKADFDALLN